MGFAAGLLGIGGGGIAVPALNGAVHWPWACHGRGGAPGAGFIHGGDDRHRFSEACAAITAGATSSCRLCRRWRCGHHLEPLPPPFWPASSDRVRWPFSACFMGFVSLQCCGRTTAARIATAVARHSPVRQRAADPGPSGHGVDWRGSLTVPFCTGSRSTSKPLAPPGAGLHRRGWNAGLRHQQRIGCRQWQQLALTVGFVYLPQPPCCLQELLSGARQGGSRGAKARCGKLLKAHLRPVAARPGPEKCCSPVPGRARQGFCAGYFRRAAYIRTNRIPCQQGKGPHRMAGKPHRTPSPAAVAPARRSQENRHIHRPGGTRETPCPNVSQQNHHPHRIDDAGHGQFSGACIGGAILRLLDQVANIVRGALFRALRGLPCRWTR